MSGLGSGKQAGGDRVGSRVFSEPDSGLGPDGFRATESYGEEHWVSEWLLGGVVFPWTRDVTGISTPAEVGWP